MQQRRKIILWMIGLLPLTACEPAAVAAPYEAVESKPLPQVTHENVMATPARNVPQAPDNSMMRSGGDAKMSKP